MIHLCNTASVSEVLIFFSWTFTSGSAYDFFWSKRPRHLGHNSSITLLWANSKRMAQAERRSKQK